ncbi:lytic transglycosylase [Prochlorococcus marinus]|uniref:lytic transglycosylase n=1 Tax=Prochlorococcus marinus TaxID=1219 RepID=UPI0022B3A91C|nr:LysM peptidoglycan-binding domain-containing protein [Prochlorococcus marinus]
MITKKKIPIVLFCINSVIFLLSIFTLKASAETKIIAKSGDTLVKISKQYRVPLKELMYKNNFNDATKIVEGEVIVIPDKNITKYKKNEHLTYKVLEGDTLYKIARDYNVNIKDIIYINNLTNDSYLKLNQIILLPKGAKYKKAINEEDIKLASKKVFYHKTSKTEDLSTIAYIHKIPIEEIKTLNTLNDPIKIKPNIKLKLRENKPSKWLKYGSLMINWSDWTYFDGKYIAQAKTKKNKNFYLALSCQNRALNNTLNNAYWTRWYFPETDFEFKLINDFCDQDFNF